MSDVEYERFEITDYDLQNEFAGNRRRLTKNERIYGIWADKESDGEEDVRPSFDHSRLPKSYTAPIGFIPGGVQQAGKPEELRAKKDVESDEEIDSGIPAIINVSSSSEDERLPTSFGGVRKQETVETEIAGLRKKGFRGLDKILNQKGVGTWERHTKGIGTKLLLQMGYQPGKGLGKDLQGIQAPIEATIRKGRGAIGAYGTETHAKVAKAEVKELKKGKKDKVTSQWRKADSGKKKTKYVFKSIEDVLSQGDQQPGRFRECSELSKVKVIDMTGKEQRVLSGYHAISGVKKPSENWEKILEKQFPNFSLPELLHNLNILVDMCEQEIITNAKSITYQEDRLIAVDVEIKKLKNVVEEEDKVANTLETLITKLEALVEGGNSGTLTFEELTEGFEELKISYPTEYMMNDIAGAAPCILKKQLEELLSTWDPSLDPEGPIDIFIRWKGLLDCELGRVHQTPLFDPYNRLIWEIWMPKIRTFMNSWDCKKNYDNMVTFVREWKPLLPPWILENVLQQIILPKIQQTVDDWNPLTDTIPIHSWTQPWMPLLGQQLQLMVFPVIRQKLGQALVAWHPSDSSARYMLMPWREVFSHPEMETFLIQYIVPKLSVCLQELDPQQQNTECWCWVVSWHELLGNNLLADLLDKAFFPKWLQMLTLWLNMSPNYDQISSWYQGWKALIPESLRVIPKVRGHLNNALELMSRSVGGPGLAPPPPAPPPPQISSLPTSRYEGMAESVRSANQMVEGFKDLVSKKCEAEGIVFFPLPNRFREGKQIYRCGSLQVYIDRSVIFYSENSGSTWIPVSLQNLLDRAALP